MSVLARILQEKQREIAALRHRTLPTAPARRFANLKRTPGQPLNILAEIKLKSPSAGELSQRMTVAERATAYQHAGAAMISVLCDHEFFGGSYADMSEARGACNLPILCKEFVIDELQLDWARAFGADAVLLIARCMTFDALALLYQAALARDLVPLVEVATLEEAQKVRDLGCDVIGVNARDLDTLELNPGRAKQILATLPNHRTRLHLSGLKTPSDVELVSRADVDGALIGEILMRQDDPEPTLARLVEAARRVSCA